MQFGRPTNLLRQDRWHLSTGSASARHRLHPSPLQRQHADSRQPVAPLVQHKVLPKGGGRRWQTPSLLQQQTERVLLLQHLLARQPYLLNLAPA